MNRLLLWGLMLWTGTVLASTIRRDEKVVFFPSLGWRTADGAEWECEIHGWIHEPERRILTIAMLAKALGLDEDLSAAERAVFEERARSFLVDNERGKTLAIRLGEREFELEKSAENGQTITRVRLPATEVDLRSRGNKRSPLEFRAVTDRGDFRWFPGAVHLLEPTGLSIISDIDDTIKISEVTDKKVLLRNTFLKSFEPVPGMAPLYRQWAANGAQFHYVSASPWQLYAPLAEFLRRGNFPEGSVHLKNFRIKDETFLDLFKSPENYKLGVLEPLLERFPRRRFALVGDSGERDPEIYGTLARRYPDRVALILIRDVTGEGAGAGRFRQAFQELPEGRWRIFREPAAIADLLRSGGRD